MYPPKCILLYFAVFCMIVSEQSNVSVRIEEAFQIHELYLPALLGGPEQVSATSETAGGDSRRGDSAAPAATELNYMEKFIEKYRMEKDGRQILPPNWLRRKPASRRTSGGVHTRRAIDGGALSLIRATPLRGSRCTLGRPTARLGA